MTRTHEIGLGATHAGCVGRPDRPSGVPSLLFDAGDRPAPDAGEPAFFRDLNLREVVDSIVGPDDEFDLRPLLHRPLGRAEAVEYRHEVFRDLESDGLCSAVRAFAREGARVRRFLSMAEGRHFEIEGRRWLLDAALVYCAAVRALVDALSGLPLHSPGFRTVSASLAEYAASGGFASLCSEADAVLCALSEVRYTVLIDGPRVTVSRYDGEPDATADVEETFARFREAPSADHLVRIADPGSMDHVEAQIAERVARLFPRAFEALARFCARHRDFVDDRIAAFDREVRFYLAVIEFTDRLKRGGVSFCYPVVSADADVISAEGAVDLALAASTASEIHAIVPNDFILRRPERVLVVTGPNQGGKTTFARMVGQLHHVASLGLPVPARSASLLLTDRILTHFERVEDISTLRGKLDDDLVRVRDILETATSRSLIVLNELFGSTTLDDATALGGRVLGRIAAIGCPAVCVTFLDELSALGPATVSMVAAVAPDDPSVRTFRIERMPADGRAYAWAIAEKYGLSYDRLRRRISR